MAAKKGNEHGKRFSSEYQPPEKWTEENALMVGFKLIDWLREKDENIFFKEFLHIKNKYPKKIIPYLSNKFKSFSTLIDDAKNIQEIKLMKYGVLDKLNATMTKLTLINNHKWIDKIETKQEINQNINLSKIRKISFKDTTISEHDI